MAFSSSSSSWSTFGNQRAGDRDKDRDTITQEEFFAFHNIDRQFFSRLVFSMKCEPMEAMHAAAFWLWLERLNMAQYIVKIIAYPDDVFKAVSEETLLCLRVVESDTLVQSKDIPMVQSIVGKHTGGVDLRYFHENRVSILRGIGHFVEKTCLRAFQDLIQIALASTHIPVNHHHQSLLEPSVIGVRGSPNLGVIGGGIGGFSPAPRPPISPIHEEKLPNDMGNLGVYPSLRVGNLSVPLKKDQNGASPSNFGPMLPANSVINNTNYALETQSQVVQGDLVDQLLAQLRVSESSLIQKFDDNSNILPSERTIFLTFSKGYPILENELREFFNRSFGDIIETLYMQEVGEKEQPLYAKLVVRDERAMEVVLSEQGRSKFSINGKHVWARKYVCKNPHSPPTSPTK